TSWMFPPWPLSRSHVIVEEGPNGLPGRSTHFSTAQSIISDRMSDRRRDRRSDRTVQNRPILLTNSRATALHSTTAARMHTPPKTSPLPPTIELLFVDEHIVVANKPCGLLVHRGWDNDDDVALFRVRDAIGAYVYPVHRLDRGTSGALLFARSAEIAGALG